MSVGDLVRGFWANHFGAWSDCGSRGADVGSRWDSGHRGTCGRADGYPFDCPCVAATDSPVVGCFDNRIVVTAVVRGGLCAWVALCCAAHFTARIARGSDVVGSAATSEQSRNGLTHAVAGVATGECEHERRGHECCFSHHSFSPPRIWAIQRRP